MFFNPMFFPKWEMASGGVLFSGLSEKGRFQPRFLSHMGKKAPLTVERKDGKGGVSNLPLCKPP